MISNSKLVYLANALMELSKTEDATKFRTSVKGLFPETESTIMTSIVGGRNIGVLKTDDKIINSAINYCEGEFSDDYDKKDEYFKGRADFAEEVYGELYEMTKTNKE